MDTGWDCKVVSFTSHTRVYMQLNTYCSKSCRVESRALTSTQSWILWLLALSLRSLSSCLQISSPDSSFLLGFSESSPKVNSTFCKGDGEKYTDSSNGSGFSNGYKHNVASHLYICAATKKSATKISVH